MSTTADAVQTDPDRGARAALSAVVEPLHGHRVARHVIAHGPAATLAQLRTGAVRELDRGGQLMRKLADVDGQAVLRAGEAAGARLLCPGDPEWPAPLDELTRAADTSDSWWSPPLALWVRGEPNLAATAERSVAIVGARAATSYGLHHAAELAAEMSSQGWTIMAGGSYGVDGQAHRGALAAGGPTVAVLACGVDVAYPQGHADLLDRIASEGLVVSELPPGARPTRARFLARNRLLAALTRGVVIVEAAMRSGALNTAAWAGHLGRPVMAMPGPVTSPMSAGCHQLIRQKQTGAVLVTGAADIQEAITEGAAALNGEPT